MTNSIKIPITIAKSQGGYTLELFVGSQQASVDVIIDTGSSTLAIKQTSYNPDDDQHLIATSIAQDVTYGAGGWAGPVIHTQINLTHEVDESHQQLSLTDAPIAIIYDEPDGNFKNVDGIFGLAYHHLNRGYDLQSYFQEKNINPEVTYPWTFEINDDIGGIKGFKKFLTNFPEKDVTPYFTELEEQNVVQNKFGLLTHRSIVHVAKKDMSLNEQLKDPLNKGFFIIGNAHKHEELHNGNMQTIPVFHDAYYNTQLLSVQVEGFDDFKAPELAEKHLHTAFTNSIIDSGSSFLMLQKDIYQYVIDCFNKINPKLAPQINLFNQARKDSKNYAPNDFDLSEWPNLYFNFAGVDNKPIQLCSTGKNYWQENSLGPGNMFCTLLEQIPGWPNQSVIGLPLMNNYYCIFDRSENNQGVIHFAEKNTKT
jgi:hypothetical protein